MYSLLSNKSKPVTNIGFPYKYYYQFWLRGSDSPNCGWDFKSFIFDCLITWIFTVCIYFLFVSKNEILNFKK